MPHWRTKPLEPLIYCWQRRAMSRGFCCTPAAMVRMAERFPVRITIADNDPPHQLRKGMRATVRIDTTVESGGR